VGIADRHAAAEERPRAVLNVLHLLELRDEIGPDKPTVSRAWFRETKLLEVPEPGHFRRACGGSRIFVCRVRPEWDRSACQSSIQGRDTVGGKLYLLLVLDVLDGSRAELSCQRALYGFSEPPANQGWWKFERLPGWQTAPHNDVGVGMVGIAVDHASPFDRRSGVLFDPGH